MAPGKNCFVSFRHIESYIGLGIQFILEAILDHIHSLWFDLILGWSNSQSLFANAGGVWNPPLPGDSEEISIATQEEG